MLKRKSFCVVCIANFCRSPVLEAFLKDRFKDDYEFYSAGLEPMQAANMDPRSIKYLEDNGLHNIIHNPKRITKKMLNYFDYFIAVDLFVLGKLNAKFPKHINKFFHATSHLDNINLLDPYKMNDEDYQVIMDMIKVTSETITL